jgi:hypothetical protein
MTPHSRGAIRTERGIPVLQHSITPLLRPAEFEGEDETSELVRQMFLLELLTKVGKW